VVAVDGGDQLPGAGRNAAQPAEQVQNGALRGQQRAGRPVYHRQGLAGLDVGSLVGQMLDRHGGVEKPEGADGDV
jgi:hypothetical protein